MAESKSSAQARRSGRLWASRAVRLVVSLAALVVLGVLAGRMATILFQGLENDKSAVNLLSVASGTVFGVTISLIKRVSLALESLGKWIAGSAWRGFTSHLVAFCVTLPLALFAIVFCLALVPRLLSQDSEMDGTERKPSPLISLEQRMKNAMAEHGYTTRRAQLLDNLEMLEPPSASEDRFRIPILFERGQLPERGETVFALPENLSDVRFSSGLDYARVQDRHLIRRLVSGLAPCAAAEGWSPVRLRVEGYASSEPFERVDADVSRRLNVQLANERRQVVERDLRSEIGRLGARIRLAEVPDYTEMSEMERSRRFNDRPGASPARGDYGQDFFTRAAYIRILDLAGCEYEGP